MQPEKNKKKEQMTFHRKAMQLQATEFTIMCLQSQAVVFPSFYPTSASSIPASYAQWGKVRGATCSLSSEFVSLQGDAQLSRNH